MTTERPHVVGVRLSKEEYRAVAARAEAEGLRPGTYVRRLVLLSLKDDLPEKE
ncbi:plasmid mobilization protein [Deinococcus phoenicis]|uniref:plasmid mobilization protein n=1 Tax=Deinococcus phoenicis TaxID=1476583 RepID=UPI003898F84B